MIGPPIENVEAGSVELSIVIPAYNEGRKILRDIHEAASFLNRHSIAGEILVVDDGSQDDTSAQVESCLASVAQLRLLSYPKNRGKGYAVRYGMAQTQGTYTLFADAGLCVPFEAALFGLTYLRLGMCDIAVANRRMERSLVKGQKLFRRIGSEINSLLVRTLMGIPWKISDTQCGFKLFRGEVARELYGKMITDRMMADVEMFLRATRANFRVMNFAVPWTNDPDTRFNPFWGQLRNFQELFHIRLALWKS